MPRKPTAPRLPALPAERLTPDQRALRDAIMASRGLKDANLGGPFGVFLHAPAFGGIVQKLGEHCRYKTALGPRLSEFAILCIARFWRAQYEWFVHAPIAEKAGVSAKTIRDLQSGREPKGAPRDERAIYRFIAELHRTKRVGDRTYAGVRAFLDDAAMVEFTGILGYYTLVAMMLNVFRVPLPEGRKPPFREPA
ncbi:MAG TPA: carboxymuconolactone decarboxylase family protein [Pseudorhodoplanes sp.]|jgi:4-carboxymuconolactone decarboxylase|nr:carboxymuconolactone decarboxylase family protein [Pseudorhodoplanes sp.]